MRGAIERMKLLLSEVLTAILTACFRDPVISKRVWMIQFRPLLHAFVTRPNRVEDK